MADELPPCRTPHQLTSRVGMAKSGSIGWRSSLLPLKADWPRDLRPIATKDLEFDELCVEYSWRPDARAILLTQAVSCRNRKFTAIESAAEKMGKDAKVFRDAVQSGSRCPIALPPPITDTLTPPPGLLYSGSTFATSFTNLFSPMGAEYDLVGKHPQAEITLKNIGQYQVLMEDLRGESETGRRAGRATSC